MSLDVKVFGYIHVLEDGGELHFTYGNDPCEPTRDTIPIRVPSDELEKLRAIKKIEEWTEDCPFLMDLVTAAFAAGRIYGQTHPQWWDDAGQGPSNIDPSQKYDMPSRHFFISIKH